mgnify:CR=1 FL=1
MESNIPKYDLPVDYIVGEGFAKDLLKSYKNFPCKIESGLFILCIKGTMEVTINTNTHHISENDLITLRCTHSHPISRFIMQAFHLIL